MREASEIASATPDRWDDVQKVFEGKGGQGRCWCAYWYSSAKDCKANWGPGNRQVLEDRVLGGAEPGVLAYVEGVPAGWAGIAPRSAFDRLVRNKKTLAAVDDRPVWSLNCLVVHREFRKQGLMRRLINGAVAFALAKGAIAVESYPVETPAKKTPWDLYLGTKHAYEDCGFVEVAKRGPRQLIMRYWPQSQ
ncbi:MAG: GNAT family N-acetyltransferase [Pseudomonadota bacterium]